MKGAQRFATSNTATGTHVQYGTTRCYLPPGSGDISATLVKLVLDLRPQRDAMLS